MHYQTYTVKKRPDLSGKLKELNRKSWPDFIIYGDTFSWIPLYEELTDFLIVLTDKNDMLIGGGFTVPLQWDGGLDDLPSSIENIIVRGLDKRGEPANTLVAIAALVDSSHRGENLSASILKEVKMLAEQCRFQNLIIPVRPTWKSRYPLQSIESYATWKNNDGLFYDPWLRTHQKLGAKVMKCVDSTLKIEGTVQNWERWTGMVFPESGAYVVKGALQPIQIDVESNVGIYNEPNVWMQHPLFGSQL